MPIKAHKDIVNYIDSLPITHEQKINLTHLIGEIYVEIENMLEEEIEERIEQGETFILEK